MAIPTALMVGKRSGGNDGEADLDYREGGGGAQPEYWARKDPRRLHSELVKRIKRNLQDYRQNPWFDQIARNWCYYHNLYGDFSDYNLFGGAVQKVGPQGAYDFVSINHLRNLLHHLFVLTVRDRPAPQVKASRIDSESLRSARVVDGVLDHYLREKRAEVYFQRNAEEAIVLTESFVSCEWDTCGGDIIGTDFEPSQNGGPMKVKRLRYGGDLAFDTHSFMDCVHDLNVYPWQKNVWCTVRDRVNKWDLAALYPDKADKIINTKESQETAWNVLGHEMRAEETDIVARWRFWHKRTPAMPFGRYMVYTEGTWLEHGVLPDYLTGLPVFRCCPSETLLTPYGYSVGFDLQGPQEAYNMTVSNILTNHDAFGIQNIWSPPGNTLSVAQVAGGLRILQSMVEPKALQLTLNAMDAYKFLELIVQSMELLSGINSVARGQPEASLKSGKALSIIEAKAVQFASVLMQSWYQVIEDTLTLACRILGHKMQEGEKRPVAVAGKQGMASFQKEFTGADLQRIDRIVIESGNALTKSISGRWDLADKLVEKDMLKTPEEILQVLTTGRIEPALQADQDMLTLLSAEKDALLEGQVAPVLKSDYHSLHLREELGLLNTPTVRQDEALAANVLGHCLVHVAMLFLPDVQTLMLMQGFQVPPLPPVLDPRVLQQLAGSPYAAMLGEQDLGVLVGAQMGGAPPGAPAGGGAAGPPKAPPGENEPAASVEEPVPA